MTIYFVRHFKTLGNTQKRYIGRTDEPLFAPAQQTLPQGLPPLPDAIFTSPMLRCLQTKELLYPALAHTVVEGLREMDFGAFEGLTYDDLKDNPHYRNFIDGIEDAQEGEATAVFKARCCEAFDALLKTCATLPQGTQHSSTPCVSEHSQPQPNHAPSTLPQTIVIVCHGGTIMSILERYAAPQNGNGSFYDYQIANGTALPCIWDGTHLTPLQ